MVTRFAYIVCTVVEVTGITWASSTVEGSEIGGKA